MNRSTRQIEIAREREDWLRGLESDCRAVREGRSRAEVEARFLSLGPAAFRAVSFLHRGCDFVEIEVDFVPFDGPRYDACGSILNEPDPRDTVWQVSRPRLWDYHKGKPRGGGFRSWLCCLITDAWAIERGSTRRQVEARFRGAGGLSGLWHGEKWCHHECAWIELELDFQPAGGALSDERDFPANRASPEDRVCDRRGPFLVTPTYD